MQTATGHFSLAVVRDMTEVRSLAGVDARSRRPGVRRGQELLDSIITRLYQVGVSLQAAAGLASGAARPHIDEALRTLDETIGQIRDSTFGDQEDQGPPARRLRHEEPNLPDPGRAAQQAALCCLRAVRKVTEVLWGW